MRVVLKGVHKVNKLLSSGAIKTYVYAWRGGPQLTAKPGTPEFVDQFRHAYAALRKPPVGTLASLVSEFKASAEFAQLSTSTVRSYTYYIKLIETAFGDLPISSEGSAGPR